MRRLSSTGSTLCRTRSARAAAGGGGLAADWAEAVRCVGEGVGRRWRRICQQSGRYPRCCRMAADTGRFAWYGAAGILARDHHCWPAAQQCRYGRRTCPLVCRKGGRNKGSQATAIGRAHYSRSVVRRRRAALLEGVLSAVGYAIAGVWIAILLGSVTFLSCILQAGPLVVSLPVAIWLWSTGQSG